MSDDATRALKELKGQIQRLEDRFHQLEVFARREIAALKATASAKTSTWQSIATLIASLASLLTMFAILAKLK